MMLGKNISHREEDLRALDYSQCLAKTKSQSKEIIEKGMNVLDHCKIVGLVARALVARLPATVRELLFPDGVDLVAASHDVGKVNPHFQALLHKVIGQDPKKIPGLEYGRPDFNKTIKHAGVSQSALEGVGDFIPEIAGRHHGGAPGNVYSKNDGSLGGEVWQKERDKLINSLKSFFYRDWPKIQDDLHAAVVAGLTTVSDWIGSGPVFENLTSFEELQIHHLVQLALDKAGFLRPIIKPSLTFADIFSGYEPFEIQKSLIHLADKPGVYVLETKMGDGKTEAALYAAYHLMREEMASGIYFALPTQLTSEKIYERFSVFLDKILEEEDPHRTLLLHGQSWLFDTELGEEARPGFSWFESKKRGLLAPFAVGTIDQALMAVMNVKHGFVRTFGLAGKVVILDEVHTYDSYTGTIMDKLIDSLASLGCTVILLSATLTQERRNRFLQISQKKINTTIPTHYPLISKSVANEETEYSEPILYEQRRVQIECSSRPDEIHELVLEKAEAGEYILWIENTVSEAQESYQFFSARGKDMGIEVGVIHSRFSKETRAELEGRWVEAFGKEGARYRGQRGMILVGTQVLEQSLDIDADFMVSRLAPTDMILQRVGRLWRHRNNDKLRPKTACEKIVVLIPSDERRSKPLECAFGGSGKVYAPYVLARSMEVLESRIEISIPTDLRILIEETYAHRSETGLLAKAKQELEKAKEKLMRYAFLGMASMGPAMPENIATRYSEIPSCDVLLLRSEPGRSEGRLLFADGSELQLNPSGEYNLRDKKNLIRVIHQKILSVPHHQAPAPCPIQELDLLKPLLYISDQEEERLRVGILEPSGNIRGLNGRSGNKNYELSYQENIGYQAKKKKED
jgi:CRISPR-associated endonuclease/helicase Cas3